MVYFLLFFCIIFPFIFIPGYHNYTIYKFAFFNFFIVGLWLFYLFSKSKPKLSIKKITRAEIYLLCFIFFVVLSTIFSIDFMLSINGSPIRHEGFPIIISYVSLFFFVHHFVKRNDIEKFLISLVLLSFIIAIYAILQHYLLDFLPRISVKEGWRRSYGFFGNPNFYGSFITLMLPISMMLYIKSDRKYKNTMFLLSSSAIFLSMLFSDTRSSWLGAFIGYLFLSIFFILKSKKYWLKWFTLSLVFFLILLGVNFGVFGHKENDVVTNRIESTVIEVQTDVKRGGSGRIFIWYKSLPLIGKYWFTGTGPDTFGRAFPNGTNDVKEFFGNGYVDKAHNEYIQMAVTLGIPALIFYLLFLYEIIKANLKSIKCLIKKETIYAISLNSAIIGYMVQAFFNISVILVAPYFWMILGLSYSLKKTYVYN